MRSRPRQMGHCATRWAWRGRYWMINGLYGRPRCHLLSKQAFVALLVGS